MTPELPAAWTLTASAFNWTPDVIRAERAAPEIAVGIVTDGIAPVIELEPGQLWRSFPVSADAEVDALRRDLDAAGGSVSIVGASLDDWLGPQQRRNEAERLAFLLPQLHAARRVGASGVRLPIGQAGDALLRRLLPTLHDLDLVLYEEIQGQQTPDSPTTAQAIEVIAGVDDPHVRLLVDISMLMPALPTSYLAELAGGGHPAGPPDPTRRRMARPRDDRRGHRAAPVGRGAARDPHPVHEPAGAVRAIARDGPSRHPAARRRLPPEVLGPRRRRWPRVRADPRPRRSARRFRLHGHAVQRVGRPRMARRRGCRGHDPAAPRPRPALRSRTVSRQPERSHHQRPHQDRLPRRVRPNQ